MSRRICLYLSLNGSVGASTGNRNTNGNVSLNFKKGKVGVSAWGGAGRWYGPSRYFRDRTDTDSSGTWRGRQRYQTIQVPAAVAPVVLGR